MADAHAADDPAVRLLPRYYRDSTWDRRTMPLFSHFTDETLDVIKQGLGRGQKVVRRLAQAGVRLHLGTDTAAMPFTVPGESLHREFRLMLEAGLSLEAVWQAGTSAAGASLGPSRLGVVQAGAPADFLIFAQDPTNSFTALATLKGVVTAGRFYAKAFLDAALARNVIVINNTFYNNGWTAWGGGIAVDNPDAQNIVIRNNIVSQNLYFRLAVAASVPTATLTIDHNLVDGFRVTEGEIYGDNTVTGDPRFVNPAGVDFHLRPNSPAMDVGSPVNAPSTDFDGRARPLDGDGNGISGHDIDAYEATVYTHRVYLPLILNQPG